MPPGVTAISPDDPPKFSDLPNFKSSVTIADVARVAGVSKMTVSNVTSGRVGVRPETRARVLAAIEHSGYQVNPLARALAGGKSRLIGITVPSLSWSYVGEIVQGASQAAEAAGLNLAVFTWPSGQPLPDGLALLRHLTGGLLSILPPDLEDESVWPPSASPPQVSVGGPGRYQLLVDNYGGARQAAAHLADLGHTRIAHIVGATHTAPHDAAERLRGYRDELQARGLSVPDAYVSPGTYHERSGLDAAQALLRLPDPPTAIFAANDAMAVGAVHAAQDLGLRVPHDLSVVGFDDLPSARAVRPNLTTVRQPLRDLGRLGVLWLGALARGEQPPSPHILPTELVVRESSGPGPSRFKGDL